MSSRNLYVSAHCLPLPSSLIQELINRAPSQPSRTRRSITMRFILQPSSPHKRSSTRNRIARTLQSVVDVDARFLLLRFLNIYYRNPRSIRFFSVPPSLPSPSLQVPRTWSRFNMLCCRLTSERILLPLESRRLDRLKRE